MLFNPHWRIWVDWNANGVWGEAGEDVAPETMRLHWEWGRSLDRERCQPARLDLDLRNDHHKFSPPNAGSPLAGNLRSGRRVWGQVAYPYDDFAAPDGTGLAGRTLPVGGGLRWERRNSGANGFELRGNRVRAVSGAGPDAIHTVDLADGDASLGLDFTRNSDGHAGLALRVVNSFNYLRIRFAATATVLERVLYGIAINIRSGDPLAAGVGHFLEVEMHGPSIRLFATDLETGGIVRKKILDGLGTAPNPSATRHGLWHDGASDADRWSHFGGWRSFFYGLVENIGPQPGRERQSCRITAFDELRRLDDALVYGLLSGSGLTAGAIANEILTQAGFSPDDRELDSGRRLMSHGPRALWRTPARQALNAVQDEEDGLVYIDGRGRLRLEASGHRAEGSHGVSRAIFGTNRGGSPYVSDLVWDDGAGGVENRVTFRYRALANRGLQEIWRLRDTPAIPPGERRDFLAESSAYDAVTGIRMPVAGADYAANREPDGSGQDMTNLLTVTLPSADAFQGKGTVVRVANGSPTHTAYVTLLKLLADGAHESLEPTIYQAVDADSRREHGERAGEIDCRFIDNYAAAQAAAEDRLARRKRRKTRLTLTLPNGGPANVAQMVHRVLSDRITVVYPEMGISQDFFIERMTLETVAATGEVTAHWLVQAA